MEQFALVGFKGRNLRFLQISHVTQNAYQRLSFYPEKETPASFLRFFAGFSVQSGLNERHEVPQIFIGVALPKKLISWWHSSVYPLPWKSIIATHWWSLTGVKERTADDLGRSQKNKMSRKRFEREP